MHTQIDQEFALGVAKSVAEARRKVLEGVGKGIGRICAAYAQQ
jgi:N-terminal acetyltransferase B complex non-catalytic subunit